jgi:hypothetical protein
MAILQRRVCQDLALATLANPILAIEALGYTFAPEIRRHIERLARFGEERTRALEEIETRLRKELGEDLDLDNGAAVAKAVLARLPADQTPAQQTPADRANAEQRGASYGAGPDDRPADRLDRDKLAAALAEVPQRRFDSLKRPEDPLGAFKGTAPVIDDLIAFREIESSRARLARPDVFHKILSGELETPITRVRFRPGTTEPVE